MTASSALLGYERYGKGALPIVVLNDWLGDTSSWEPARPYLDLARYSWTFADLRGYGRSRGLPGAHNLAEATADVLQLADASGWSRFAVVGHSMSCLVTLQLAQQHADRIACAVLVTPPPPFGFGADASSIAATRAVVTGPEEGRVAMLRGRFAGRLSPGWATFKAERWRATSDADAVADYVAMFARDGLSERAAKIERPVLAVCGAHDMRPMQEEAVRAALAPLCSQLEVLSIADAGHYPMQETPPLLVGQIERFLLEAYA